MNSVMAITSRRGTILGGRVNSGCSARLLDGWQARLDLAGQQRGGQGRNQPSQKSNVDRDQGQNKGMGQVSQHQKEDKAEEEEEQEESSDRGQRQDQGQRSGQEQSDQEHRR